MLTPPGSRPCWTIPNLDIDALFDNFLKGLQDNLNAGVTRDNAIEMLAQHLITRPVFDALFEGYAFAEHNPVSIVMQDMLDALDEQGIESESDTLDQFYASVRLRADGIDNAEGKQQIITELYERFFKTAFPRSAESLGIVYTPLEIVDFIIRSVEQVLRDSFDTSISEPGVHVLDPFTGTGTFIVRLLQSGLIKPDALLHKYTNELHANEINLLAYYIAAVNIEAAFHGIAGGEYQPFNGIVLTDTFQMFEEGDAMDELIFPQNNERVVRQKSTDIRVILANPPYSVGQGSQNDNNQNVRYPTLDDRIESTYARRSAAVSKRTLYDSYVRAIRWASDRIQDRGVVCYVSNGSYIDSNTADGLRKCLIDEFDDIYVFNLRGNQRTAGELSRKEGGKVFASGSRNTVAIVLLARRQVSDRPGTLHYRDIGDYLTRERKLEIVADSNLRTGGWQTLLPNAHGDWINQRRSEYASYLPLAAEPGGTSIFAVHSLGVATARDAWVYGFSVAAVHSNVRRTLDAYSDHVERWAALGEHRDRDVGGFIDTDPRTISWSDGLKRSLAASREIVFDPASVRPAVYRPFTRSNLYFNRGLNDRWYQQGTIFPTPSHENLGLLVMAPRAEAVPTVLALDALPDQTLFTYAGQFFPRWTYEKVSEEEGLFSEECDEHGYRRMDNIPDATLAKYREMYGGQVSKDDIFFYVYGLLHSPEYRSEFAADLRKMLPRIPMVRDFAGFAEAGRMLADLHVGYEAVTPFPLQEIVTGAGPGDELYVVRKMTFGRGATAREKDRTRIVYNSRLTVVGIPEEAYRYELGSRSAIEWIMDRYQVRTDKASGIVNDPNDWATEHSDPRYILDLLKRIVTVSVETMRIIDALPPLDIIE